MSSYPAKRSTTPLFTLWLAALLLAICTPAQAASELATGADASASARVQFRIVIPGHLHLAMSEPANGSSMLDVELYSRRGALTVSSDDAGETTALASVASPDAIKTTRVRATGGVYTIASP